MCHVIRCRRDSARNSDFGDAPWSTGPMTNSTLRQGGIRSIAMLGNHPPRRCGIATFTSDLTDAIEREFPALGCSVVAMNDVGSHYAYPPRVRFEIAEGEVEAYRLAADFLNLTAVEVLSVQHEYGIFGGKAGGHVIELLRGLRAPIVTTLHTILERPDRAQRAVLDAIVAVSERVVVMSADGAALLASVHGVDRAKIDVIPHGIPVAPEHHSKELVGAEGSPIILTFGLVSPDKGIEYVIDAMPAILARHPTAIYIVLGATHPHVKQEYGEAYRQMLQARAARLGVEASVVFHNRFVRHEELMEFLGAADIYVTPYLKEEQSTSGTLAYAVGCGKAVVSTPYRYARELLADGRGVLVPWRDSAAIGQEITSLLDDPVRRGEFQRRAAALGRSMSWPIVARSYVASFEKAREAYDGRRRVGRADGAPRARRPDLPELNLAHVRLMTDDTGMLQHATFDIPNYADGYCVDDNARALLLMTHVEEAGTEAPHVVRSLATRYLAFIAHALDERSGRFRNFLTYSRTWHDAPGSDDSHGRTLWALGSVVKRSTDPGRRHLSERLFRAGLASATTLISPRAWAYTLLGIDEFLGASDDARAVSVMTELADRLLVRFRHSSSAEWPWFEDRLTYCNARLPHALLLAARRLGDAEMTEVAERSLTWLVDQQIAPDRSFSPIGTNGFHVQGTARAAFDQQPVEACSTVSACLEAHRLTGEHQWLEHARRAFQWFLGRNSLHALVFDARTGGCRDGLHADRLNENQGAESTLSFLTALAEMRAAERIASKLLAAPTDAVGAPRAEPRAALSADAS